MKKTYINPQAIVLELSAEGMMAASIAIGGTDNSGTTEKVKEEVQVLSNRHGWDSSNWTETGDED